MNSPFDQYISASFLYLDIKGYSLLDEDRLSKFHKKVYPEIHAITEKIDGYLYKNTWGDGIILVHNDSELLLDIALEIRDYFRSCRYTTFDLLRNTDLGSRLFIGRGEFLRSSDPFTEREGLFGIELVATARLEPLVPPNRVLVSSEVKDHVEMRLHREARTLRFKFTDLGAVELAKQFGSSQIFEVTFKGELSVAFESDQMSKSSPIRSDDFKSTQKSNFSRRIFIIHGHDGELKNEIARLLERLDFIPVILHEQADRGQTIFLKLSNEMADIGFAFVLLTPDDVGALKQNIESLQPRARQNVVYEHGLFTGHLGQDRVCAICKGDIEIPSDLHGILYKKIPVGSGAWSIALDIIQELRAAGYEVDANKLN